MKNPANAGFFLFKEIYPFKILKKNKKKVIILIME